jgi:hypothetical protein
MKTGEALQTLSAKTSLNGTFWNVLRINTQPLNTKKKAHSQISTFIRKKISSPGIKK